MASSDWIEIYQSYSSDELTDEINNLKTQLKNASGINSQGIGSKSYSRDLLHLQNRLHAAIRVQTNRQRAAQGPKLSGGWGVPDFSQTGSL